MICRWASWSKPSTLEDLFRCLPLFSVVQSKKRDIAGQDAHSRIHLLVEWGKPGNSKTQLTLAGPNERIQRFACAKPSYVPLFWYDY